MDYCKLMCEVCMKTCYKYMLLVPVALQENHKMSCQYSFTT